MRLSATPSSRRAQGRDTRYQREPRIDTTTSAVSNAEANEFQISLVRNDLFFRAQRAIGLIPATGLGVGRRALALALFTWAPIAVWAAIAQRALPGAVTSEPLFQHFGVTVRCLVAIPLLVIAEGVAHAMTTRLVPHFVRSGLVRDADRERFCAILEGVARLRDRSLPWILIGSAVAAWLLLGPPTGDQHELSWAADSDAPTHFGFGGIWFLYVVRPIFVALVLAWLWRLFLFFMLMSRIAKLDLELVPTHPDRAGGLGFLETLPSVFSAVVLAASAVLASRWAHDVVYHGMDVQSLRLPGIVFVVSMLLLFLAPLLPFGSKLRAAKRKALLDYGALVGRHGRGVEQRWIRGESVDDALLAAPEIGPVADTVALYEAVSRMRTVPIGRPTLLMIVLPALLPLLAVFAIQVPIKEILKKLVTTLI